MYIFDTARPGRDFKKRPTFKKNKRAWGHDGQAGILSTIAFNGTGDGSGGGMEKLFACGSYNGTVGLYAQDESCSTSPCCFRLRIPLAQSALSPPHLRLMNHHQVPYVPWGTTREA
jgi:hypothetical protein